MAAHQLGKCCRDGLGVIPDDEKAETWFRAAAEKGLDFSQYALGKLLQSEQRVEEAVHWYERASAQGNQYADYRLGKLYLAGEGIPRDEEKAVAYLTASAESGNQYAQYALGKYYLERGEYEQARAWFTQSAAQGNEYAQFFLDRWASLGPPSVMLSVTQLLHHMSRILQSATPAPAIPGGIQIDRKRMEQLREKKMAMGHKPNDHEDLRQIQQQSMGGMTMGW